MFRERTPLHYQGNIANLPMLISPPYEITDNYGTWTFIRAGSKSFSASASPSPTSDGSSWLLYLPNAHGNKAYSFVGTPTASEHRGSGGVKAGESLRCSMLQFQYFIEFLLTFSSACLPFWHSQPQDQHLWQAWVCQVGTRRESEMLCEWVVPWYIQLKPEISVEKLLTFWPELYRSSSGERESLIVCLLIYCLLELWAIVYIMAVRLNLLIENSTKYVGIVQ